jgi:translation initiation factor 4E
MAGYFSNHSHSRFLANSTATQTTATPAPSSSARSRPPSSKHFSTSVSASWDEKPNPKERALINPPSNGASGVHPLRNTYVRTRSSNARFRLDLYTPSSSWVFWFRQQRAPGNKITSYEEGIKKISAFSSVSSILFKSYNHIILSTRSFQVESFWSLWTHLNPPSALQPTTDYLLFHTGIRRPVWEDPLNLTGGKWIIRLKKGVADRIWEDLILAIIGDQFDECRAVTVQTENSERLSDDSDGSGEWPEICGCTISVRQSEDILSVWNRYDGDVKVKERIRSVARILDNNDD